MFHSFSGQIKTNNNNNNNQELKLQRVDVLEKLSEETLLKTYNEEFYSCLIKQNKLPPITSEPPKTDDDKENINDKNKCLSKNKLFYHFEQNINASVSSTTGQLDVNFLFINKRQHVKRSIAQIKT